MGGHGGLNILPQKRWNVYNFDNRERVKRDEEAAAREEQVRRVKARQAELEFKLDKLREVNQSKRRRVEQIGGAEEGAPAALEGAASEGAIVPRGETSGGAERPQHINFFAEFEARASEEGHGRASERAKGGRQGDDRERRGGGRDERSRKERAAGRGGVEKVDGKPTGEPVNENYGLGHGATDKNGKKPWYTYKSFMVDRTTTSTTNGERHRPDEKLQITDGLDKKNGKPKKKTVEELRAERLRREEQENLRVRKLVARQAVKSSTGYDRLSNGRVPQYHGSFGNAR